jgi:hypothetical protein
MNPIAGYKTKHKRKKKKRGNMQRFLDQVKERNLTSDSCSDPEKESMQFGCAFPGTAIGSVPKQDPGGESVPYLQILDEAAFRFGLDDGSM